MESQVVAPETATWRRTLGEYAFAVVVGMAALAVVLDLPHRDFETPLANDGDSLFYLLIAKGVSDTGSPYHFPHVGAPFGLDLHDFSNFPPLHVFTLKVLGLVIATPALLLNVFYLVSFPLTLITSLGVLRHFRCSYGPALVGSLLFTFAPYHFFRGPSTLTSYFMVPLALMVVLWVYRGEPLFFVPDATGKERFRIWHGKTLMAVLALLGLALSDVYYSFFACFLLVLAGWARAWETRTFRPTLVSGLLIGVVVTGSVLCLTPAVIYALEHGGNHDAMQRSMIDSEHFGLRIAQMLMPITGHRLHFLANLKQHFNTKMIMISENEHASLGLLGSLGFLLLVFRLLAPRDGKENPLWVPLSRLNAFAVMLGTIGGFGLLVAAALPQIRAYNRICLFVGFFAVFALALVLQEWQARWSATASGRWLVRAVLGVLAVVGILDQTPRYTFPPSSTWNTDAAFVQTLEERLPAQTMIYQLPYRVFPEGLSYSHLRLSMHSRQLHWSYPVMRSRPTDFWHKELAAKPVDELLPQLVLAGFEGVCLERGDDLDPELEKKLADRLKLEPIVSADRQFAFYPLQEYKHALQAKVSPATWQRLHEETVHPVVVSWLRGFMRTPEMYPKDGRWCTATGTMQLCNLGETPRSVRLTLSVRSGFRQPAKLKIQSAIWKHEAVINDREGEIDEILEVPPGRHVVQFSCDAAFFNDNPRRVFRVVDFKVLPTWRGTQAALGTHPK